MSSSCLIGKLIEGVVFDQIVAHVRRYGLINDDHHGGRAGRSTSTCILDVLDIVQQSHDSGQIPAVMALDLSAAYDLVNHDILLERCRLLSLSSHTLLFVRDFLKSRSQAIENEGRMSPALMSGDCGVVQGGISSGDLFTIYLNDLPKQVTDQGQDMISQDGSGRESWNEGGEEIRAGQEDVGVMDGVDWTDRGLRPRPGARSRTTLRPQSRGSRRDGTERAKSKDDEDDDDDDDDDEGLRLSARVGQTGTRSGTSVMAPKVRAKGKEFVDDITIVAMGHTIALLKHNLQANYEVVAQYLTNYRMAINGSKSQLMVMGSNPDYADITIQAGGVSIPHQPNLKLLGVTLSASGKFDHHIFDGPGSMTTRLQKRIGLIKCIRPYLSRKTLATIGGALVNSVILYGAGVWGQTTSKNFDRIQAAQLRVARVILNEKGLFGSFKSKLKALSPNLFQLTMH